jgi:hypothetical protein
MNIGKRTLTTKLNILISSDGNSIYRLDADCEVWFPNEKFVIKFDHFLPYDLQQRMRRNMKFL